MRPIRRILIANRAEIANRIAMTCRDLGIESVGVYSDADRTLHVRGTDLAVRLGPPPADQSYLDGERLLEAARRTGCDAVHPGYGFLAENADFAASVEAAGLAWIGPPPAAIRAMGDKAQARKLAAAQDVPIVPGYDGDSQDPARFVEEATRIGFPVLVKAAAGGGGRGMRRVDRPEDLTDALASAAREAESAFGSPTLILERYIERPRHIEVQVFGDSQGEVVHLFERECSVQRRHQKVVEEAPSPAVDDALRDRLGEAAVKVAKAVGYVGAGTVEFILDRQGRFHFLEMNTRLQVEHPVTEEITSLDLVELQIRVAQGLPLPFAQEEVVRWGHAIEVRLYAEDPLRDYLPASGRLIRLDLPVGVGLRVDAGYRAGDEVGVHYDSMLAKIIARGDTREQAVQRLRYALARAWVPGIATNLPLLRQIVAHPAFEAGELDTHFLPRHNLPQPPPLNLWRGALAATAVAWSLRQQVAPHSPAVPRGFRVEGPATLSDVWRCGAEEVRTSWRALSEAVLEVEVALTGEVPTAHRVRIDGFDGGVLRHEVDGVYSEVRVALRGAGLDDDDVVYLHFGDGESVMQLVPRFPPPVGADVEEGSCVAPTPGTVVAVHVAAGDAVSRGDKLVTIEAMKMEHALTAPSDGTVAEVRCAIGDAVDQGAVLLRIEV